MSTSKPRVLLTRRWPQPIESLLADDFALTVNQSDEPLDDAALLKALNNHDAVCPTVTDKLSAELIDAAASGVRLLANYGVGYNHIALEAAERNTICVTNTPGVLTEATADLTMTLLLMAARRAGEGERLARSGNWQGWAPTQMLGSDVYGKTLGLIGFGRIARAVARRAHFGFGMTVRFLTPRPPAVSQAQACGAEAVSDLDTLLGESDFISLHCPGGAETRHLINSAALKQMKPSAFLINTARGEVVDEPALINALTANTIAGAGLDVYAREPLIGHQLSTLNNVVLLPHLGSATERTRIAMGERARQNLLAFFAGQEPPDRVV